MVRRAREIVIVSHYFPPHIGGIEIVAQAEAEGLAKAGHKVSVITSKISRAEQGGLISGVRVLRVPALNIFEKFGIPYPIFSPTLITTTFRNVKRSDVVHVHDTFYLTSLLGGLAAKYYKKPLVLTQHVDFVSHPNWLVGVIERAVYALNGAVIFRSSQRALVINDRTKRFLVSRGVNENRIVRLPNGVDTSLFRPSSGSEKKKLRQKLGLDVDGYYVLFIGRYAPKKGYGTMLGARNTSYHILFAGGDNPGKTYDHASFLGKLSHAEIANLFRAVDVFVLPSKDEGFPLTVQEAMACGLPVITSDDPGYTTYMLDKKLIWLLKDPTAGSVKKSILSLQTDTDQQKLMSSYSRKYAVEHFSWKRHMSELSAVYDSVLVVGSSRS